MTCCYVRMRSDGLLFSVIVDKGFLMSAIELQWFVVKCNRDGMICY